ncbi:TetR/AcrR family transcriptional regulator [Mycolicibacterium sp.]|uniref:TetR/AcrR family transcriptional regulator n=1 Tax=Mycolicibacterium sp. TaxID=2320850 RepID=UPI003D0A02FE
MTSVRKRERNPKGAGDRLREEIVAAAADLIAEKGQEGLTLRGIARRVGITAPAIYAHFDDLDQVWDAVNRETFAAFAHYLRERGRGVEDPTARLRAYCQGYIRFGLDHPLQYAVLFGRAAIVADRPDKAIDTMVGGEAFAILRDAIGDCVTAGTSGSTNPVDDATAVWVALHGYVGLQAALPDFPWPPEDSLLDTLVTRLARLTPGGDTHREDR